MEIFRIGPGYVFYGDPTQASGAGMTYIGETRDDIVFAPEVNVVFARSDQQGMTPVAGSTYSSGPQPVIRANLFDEDKDKLVSYMPDAEKISRTVAVPAETAPAAWSSGTDYVVGDKVTVSGSYYIANRAHTSATGNVANGAPGQSSATAWDDYTLAPASTATYDALGLGAGWQKIEEQTACIIPQDQVGVGTNGIGSNLSIWLPAAVCNGVGEWMFRLGEGNDAFNRRQTLFTSLRRSTDQGGTAITRRAQCGFIGSPLAYSLAWSLPAIS